MRHVIGGLGRNAKIVFDERRDVLRIWEKGFIGKRKYRINVNQVTGVMYGWYTSRVRLPLRGFVLEFNHKGKSVTVAIPGETKSFVLAAEVAARAIGRSARLPEHRIDGSNVLFSRTAPSGAVPDEAPKLAPDGTPLTKTEQVIAGAAREAKNIAGEIASDAGNALSGVGKVLFSVAGVVVFLSLLGSGPVLAVILLVAGIIAYRKSR